MLLYYNSGFRYFGPLLNICEIELFRNCRDRLYKFKGCDIGNIETKETSDRTLPPIRTILKSLKYVKLLLEQHRHSLNGICANKVLWELIISKYVN